MRRRRGRPGRVDRADTAAAVARRARRTAQRGRFPAHAALGRLAARSSPASTSSAAATRSSHSSVGEHHQLYLDAARAKLARAHEAISRLFAQVAPRVRELGPALHRERAGETAMQLRQLLDAATVHEPGDGETGEAEGKGGTEPTR